MQGTWGSLESILIDLASEMVSVLLMQHLEGAVESIYIAPKVYPFYILEGFDTKRTQKHEYGKIRRNQRWELHPHQLETRTN